MSEPVKALPPFVVDTAGYVWASGPKGRFVIANIQIRGWGYLTGGGHGALGLSDETAIKTQEAWRKMIKDALNAFAANDPSSSATTD